MIVALVVLIPSKAWNFEWKQLNQQLYPSPTIPPDACGVYQVSCVPTGASQPLFPPFAPNLDSTNNRAKFTHPQDLACSSLREQLSPSPSILLEKQAQLKALYSCTLRTCFPCLSHAQLPSLIWTSPIGYSQRGFYHTLGFLPFRQTVLQIRFQFKTVKNSTSKQDTSPLTGRHYFWGAKGLAYL